MSDDWTQLLARSGYLGALYDGAPPSLDMCELFYFHIDERESSVTLGFVTRSLPVNPPSEWEGRVFNAFEFYLVCSEVDGLQVTGWGVSEAHEINFIVREGEVIDVTLGTENSGITFRAGAVRLSRQRAYLASDTP